MPLDLARAHAACIHGQDLVVEARKPSLMLANDLRLEVPHAIPGNFDLDFTKIPHYRLAARPVSRVAATATLGIVLFVAYMVGELGIQRSFDQRLRQLLEQSVLA